MLCYVMPLVLGLVDLLEQPIGAERGLDRSSEAQAHLAEDLLQVDRRGLREVRMLAHLHTGIICKNMHALDANLRKVARASENLRAARRRNVCEDMQTVTNSLSQTLLHYSGKCF